MPDWFYRTAAQRVLFCLPDEASRGIALGTIGVLGNSPLGRHVIEFMGHMAPDPRLKVNVAGIDFASPIGIGWRVDPDQQATAGLGCFGAGCVEVLAHPVRGVRRDSAESLSDAIPRHPVRQRRTVPGVLQLERLLGDDRGERVRLPNGTVLPVVAWDRPPSSADLGSGVVLQAGSSTGEGWWTVPAAMPAGFLAAIRRWRSHLGPEAPLVVSGGIGGPRDAVAAIEADANLLLVDAGLVYRGPGLIKRCNAALLARLPRPEPVAASAGPLFRRAWFWAALLGSAMLLGGASTLVLALSRVLLPYDEHYLGLSAEALRRTTPRLFAFMAHDRATLAGTMLGLGWLYLNLAWSGIRRARHGARTATIASAAAGFFSFFSFFGFGYFDTLHAFVAVVLMQLTVQIMIGDEAVPSLEPQAIDDEDSVWRAAQWAQLLWVIHAVGLLIAGGVILSIGMTAVFVSEDLGFLCLTPDQAKNLGARLIGVVAHDRATLGGMLLASGVAMLLPVLWCFRRGARWLWQAMLGLGLPAYAAAIGIHLWVGYTDWRHMAPAIAGLFLWLAGLALGYRYLHRDDGATVAAE